MREKDLKETGLADMAFKVESDHEVQMARAELYKVAKYAIKMHEMLKGVEEREGLEGWVQSKITKAADYLSSVYHHMDYEMKFDQVSESRLNESKMPTKAHVMKMCKDGMSEAEMLKMHPDADKDKLKELIKKCKEDLKENKEKKQPEKMDVTDADKKHNTPAYQRMKAGDKRYNDKTTPEKKEESYVDILAQKLEEKKKSKGLYYNVNKRKKAGTSRSKNHPDAPSEKDWENAAKTAKESVESKCPDCGNPSYKTLPEEKQKGVDGKVCWKGYKRMGTKKKGGKTVDNCVKM
jgi:hypothetical protein|tara:strand:- start:4559 stop:5437 length:879 start_codon:yes stop_codon:yes gene_type:complete